jgi:hypothetical protein
MRASLYNHYAGSLSFPRGLIFATSLSLPLTPPLRHRLRHPASRRSHINTQTSTAVGKVAIGQRRAKMARHLSVIVILAIAAFLSLTFLMSFGDRHDQVPQTFNAPGAGSHLADSKSSGSGASLPIEPVHESVKDESKVAGLAITDDILKGGAIAPKLENATIKYVMLAPTRPLSPPDGHGVILERCEKTAAAFHRLHPRKTEMLTGRSLSTGLSSDDPAGDCCTR